MNAIASYRTRRVDTASPLQLVVMLYQELLRRIELGSMQLESGSPVEAVKHFHHAREIVTELLAALDPSAESEALVLHLSGLYKWTAAELIAAGKDRDPARSRRVAEVLMPVLEGWTEILARGAR